MYDLRFEPACSCYYLLVISMKVEAKGQTAFEIDLCQANEFFFQLSKVKWCDLKLKCIQLNPLILCHELLITLPDCGL